MPTNDERHNSAAEWTRVNMRLAQLERDHDELRKDVKDIAKAYLRIETYMNDQEKRDENHQLEFRLISNNLSATTEKVNNLSKVGLTLAFIVATAVVTQIWSVLGGS